MADKKSSNNPNSKVFSYDVEGVTSEMAMPSVSRLLDRKKLFGNSNSPNPAKAVEDVLRALPTDPFASPPSSDLTLGKVSQSSESSELELRPDSSPPSTRGPVQPTERGNGPVFLNLDASVDSLEIQLSEGNTGQITPPSQAGPSPQQASVSSPVPSPTSVAPATPAPPTAKNETQQKAPPQDSPESVVLDLPFHPPSPEEKPEFVAQTQSQVPKKPALKPGKGFDPTNATQATRVASPAQLSKVTQTQQPQNGPKPVIKKAVVRSFSKEGAPPPLIQLVDDKEILNSANRLHQAFTKLLAAGASSVLVLYAKELEVVAERALRGSARQLLWSGLKWNPHFTPDLWTALAKSGFLELSPEAQSTGGSKRALRAAFGVEAKEYLTLVQMDARETGIGVIAVFSQKGIQPSLLELRPLVRRPQPSPGATQASAQKRAA